MTETMTHEQYRAEVAKPKAQSESAETRALFLLQMRARKLPVPRSKDHPLGEVRFASEVHGIVRQGRRKRTKRAPQWSFDFAFLEQRIAVEVEGLVVYQSEGRMVTRGRHTTPQGFNDDCEKYAWAAVLGWTVVRFTPKQVKAGFAIDMLVRLFGALRAPVTLRAGIGCPPLNVTDELSFGGPRDADPF